MSILSWVKESLLDTIGVGYVLDAVVSFGGSLDGQEDNDYGALLYCVWHAGARTGDGE